MTANMSPAKQDAGALAQVCDGCGKPCGAAAALRGDYTRSYTFNCPECDREYCAVCLKDEPGYNADGDCVGDPPRMVDASSWKGACRKCSLHTDDCGWWSGEACSCAQRFGFEDDRLGDIWEGDDRLEGHLPR